MGQIQTNSQVEVGAVNLDLFAGPGWSSPFTLHSILYRRTKTEAIDIIVEAVVNGRSLVIDRVLGTGDIFYVFPNQRVTYPISLSNGFKIRFRTDKVTSVTEDHSVFVQWADFT
jgi:hypothetical protein